MKVNFSHLREHSTSGGWINFAVFDAQATSNTNSANAEILAQLTMKARHSGLRIDQSALAFSEGGRIKFYGTQNLVNYLSRAGLPQWTHSIDV